MYQYQVPFGKAISMAFSSYCDFSGRASRSEYWWFYLFNVIIGFVSTIVSGILFGLDSFAYYVIPTLASLVLLLPGLGLTVRRLHDTGRGGGWIFISLIPLVGAIILIVFLVQPSENGDNRFGDIPNLTN